MTTRVGLWTSTATCFTESDSWHDVTHAVSSNKQRSLAIWSPTALPSSSEVYDYIGRSLPFSSVKQKEMPRGLQEALWHFVPSGN